jgi:hypothetical protein
LNEDDEDEDEDKEVEDARRKHGDAVGKAVREGGRQNKYGTSTEAALVAGAGQMSMAKRGIVNDKGLLEGGRAGQRDRGRRTPGAASVAEGRWDFELDMDGATLLGRRHKRAGLEPSLLAGKPIGPTAGSVDFIPPGSPMRVV